MPSMSRSLSDGRRTPAAIATGAEVPMGKSEVRITVNCANNNRTDVVELELDEYLSFASYTTEA